VDDVRTTGATLNRARRRLDRIHPAMVVGAVIAVSDAAARRIRTR
jgi:predicted amidophosphoribosyltransferase